MVYQVIKYPIIKSTFIEYNYNLWAEFSAISILKLCWERGVKENDKGVNSTVINSKNICKCHNVPPVQQK
jgi:hypothetical protein